jgi:hypothetical protein
MTTLEAQFPIAGRECRFYLRDESTFIGVFDHGGAREKSKIMSTDGKNLVFEQFAEGEKSYSNILGWENYIKTKS